MNTQDLEPIPRARILAASFLGAVLLLGPLILFARALAQVNA